MQFVLKVCGFIFIIICGFIRENGQPELNIFEQPEFKLFRDSLNGEMKRLTSEGVDVEIKQAEPLSRDEEDILWGKHYLGGSKPRTLLDTMVFLLRRCFGLRRDKEYGGLKFKQLSLIEGADKAQAKLCYFFLAKRITRED